MLVSHPNFTRLPQVKPQAALKVKAGGWSDDDLDPSDEEDGGEEEGIEDGEGTEDEDGTRPRGAKRSSQASSSGPAPKKSKGMHCGMCGKGEKDCFRFGRFHYLSHVYWRICFPFESCGVHTVSVHKQCNSRLAPKVIQSVRGSRDIVA